MLDTCVKICSRIQLKFNPDKSFCISFGKSRKFEITPMLLDNSGKPWLDSVRYLGVYLVSNKKLSFICTQYKRNFYAAFNCIRSRAK